VAELALEYSHDEENVEPEHLDKGGKSKFSHSNCAFCSLTDFLASKVVAAFKYSFGRIHMFPNLRII
jgi:hypothetical protein